MNERSARPQARVTAVKQVYLAEMAPQVDEIRFAQRFDSGAAAMRYVLEAGLHAAGYLAHDS
jgi:hypothetical protein